MSASPEETLQRFQRLAEALKDTRKLVVLTHDNPDPDSISSAVTLAYLVKNKFKIPAIARYTGIVGRAENRAMIRELKLRISPLQESDLKSGVQFAAVDMQPGTGNSAFPKNRKPVILIDHHPLRKSTKADYVDIRTDYGATATVLAEYLLESGLEITPALATALSYGISSETQDLGREAGPKDIQAYLALFPASNKKLLSKIEHPRLPHEYFVTLSRALHHSFVRKSAVATCLGEIKNPDFVAFIADFMLRLERITWSLCLGRYKDRIIVSVRTTNTRGEASRFLGRLLGKRGTSGGHGMIAGGQIACASMEHDYCTKIEDEIVQAFFRLLGDKEPAELKPLLISESATGI